MITKKQSVCDHKFVGTNCCLKCGWVPSAAVMSARLNPMHVVAAPALSPEERAERAWSAFATEYYVPDEPLVSDSTLFKAGYLARDKEKP